METITITVDGITSHERESQSIYTHFFWIPMGTLQPQNGTGGGGGGAKWGGNEYSRGIHRLWFDYCCCVVTLSYLRTDPPQKSIPKR